LDEILFKIMKHIQDIWISLITSNSNVRKSSAARDGKIRESIISDWQFGQ